MSDALIAAAGWELAGVLSMETSTREDAISASTIAIQARRSTRVLQLPTRAVADPEGLRPFASTAAACSRSEPAGFASPPHDGFALVGEGTAGASAADAE